MESDVRATHDPPVDCGRRHSGGHGLGTREHPMLLTGHLHQQFVGGIHTPTLPREPPRFYPLGGLALLSPEYGSHQRQSPLGQSEYWMTVVAPTQSRVPVGASMAKRKSKSSGAYLGHGVSVHGTIEVRSL